MKVVISGGGIAGLATAGFLLQQGIEPVIIEKTAKWSKVGYGISLWGNGIKMMQALGLDQRLIQNGRIIDKWTIRNSSDKPLSEIHLDYEHIPPLIAIHRADLHALLLSKVPDRLIRMNTSIEEMETAEEKVQLRLSTGESVQADLLIGADGTHSRVRELLFDAEDAKPRDTGMAVFSFWIPQELEVPEGFNEIYSDTGYALLFAPVNNRKMCSIAFTTASGDKKEHLSILRKKIPQENCLSARLFKALEKEEDAFHDSIYQLHLDQWVSKNTVLIGDAAHALHPIVGMGASLALEDGYVLAQEILEHKYGRMDKALQSFQERRQKRISRFYRQASITSAFTFTENNLLAKVREKLLKNTALFEGFFMDNASKLAKDVLTDL